MDWLSYAPADFLMFAPRTYDRLVAGYNQALWPAQLAALALALALPFLLRRGGAHSRVALAILAGFWLWTGWGFHLERFAAINTGAIWFAAGFALEALLLVAAATLAKPTRPGRGSRRIERAGLGLLLFAALLQPLVGLLAGRDWPEFETVGLMPDPTASATLGALLALGGRTRWELLAIPVLWCLVAGAMSWAMERPDAALMPVLALVALVLAFAKSRSRR
jgi:hypothetical protein